MNNQNAKRVVHVLYNTFTADTRVLKELKSLEKLQEIEHLTLIALGNYKLPTHLIMTPKITIHRINLISSKLPQLKITTLLKLIEWHLRVWAKLFKQDPHIVHCHDIIPLFSGMLFKILKPCFLIYDSHEFQSEMKIAKGWRKPIYRFIELLGSLISDAFITVSKPIAENYQYLFNYKNPTLIMNCPHGHQNPVKSNYFREKFKIKDDEVVFIYQGALMNGRGVDTILESFQELKGSKNHIVFMGFGLLDNLIIEASQKYSNIHFLPSVDASKVIEYTSSADVGITITDYSCKNHLYSLPNKFFDYIQAGIPVICTNLISVREITELYRIGIVINEISASSLKLAILSINNEYKNYKSNLQQIQNHYVWEKEETKLLTLYRSIPVSY